MTEPEPLSELSDLVNSTLRFEAVLTSSRQLEYQQDILIICAASLKLDERFLIMTLLHDALVSKEWHKLFNGLRILTCLIESGSDEIFVEVLQGKHFDILQKTLFLKSFANADDRVSKLIRRTAADIREKLLRKLNEVESCLENGQSFQSSSTGISYRDIVTPVFENSVSHLVSLRHVESDSDMDDHIPTDSLL